MVFIVLPAYNEEEGLEKLLERIRRITRANAITYRLVIVNDGSRDHTAQVVQSFAVDMPIELVNFTANAGVTEVFRTGFRRVCAEGADDDVCITMDADNTQNPYVMLDVLNKLRNGCDIVVASRFEPGGGMVKAPVVRRMLSLGVAWLLRNAIGIEGIKDYSTFYRGYRVSLLKRGFARYGDRLIDGEGFSGMADMLIKLCGLAGGRVGEVPLVLRYDLKEGGSGMRIFPTIGGYIGVVARHHRFARRGRRATEVAGEHPQQ